MLYTVPKKRIREITIATINIRTLSDDIKLGQTFDVFRALRHDVCMMQETRRIAQGCIEQDDGVKFIWSGMSRKKAAGVGIMLAPRVKLVDTKYVSPRLLQTLVKINGLRLAVTCCYAPTNCAKDSQKDSFYRDLCKTLKDTSKSYKHLIGGDLNATIGKDNIGLWSCLGPTHKEQDTNNNGTRLLEFAEEFNLRLENTIRPSKPRLISTWHSATGFEKRLDYILTSKLVHRYVRKCRVRRGSSELFDSDHFLLEMGLYVPGKKEISRQHTKKPRKPRADVQFLKEENIQKAYVEKLNELFANEPDTEDIEQLNIDICEGLGEATKSVCPELVQTSITKPWEDDQLKALMKKQWKTRDKTELKNLRKEIKDRRDILINIFYGKKASSINDAVEQHDVAREFREAKKFVMHQKTSRNLISNKKLHNHFESHLGNDDTLPMPPELEKPEETCLKDHLNAAAEVDQGPPTMDELQSHMKKLKNQKCTGVEQVQMESIKYATESLGLCKHLLLLICLVWSTLTVPAIWLKSTITCLFKKGSQTEATNYRGISITATLARLIPMIILERLRKPYDECIDHAQCGFRPNKGCDDAIFILRNIVEGTGTTMYLSFIDLTAAYDKIPRRLLFRALNIRLGAKHLVALIQAIYTQTTAKIRGSKLFFPVKTGCRQGGIESPMIFNIYFDTVCRVLIYELKEELGDDAGIEFRYRIPIEATNREQRLKCPAAGIGYVTNILYADDKIIFFKNLKALQRGLEIVEEVFTRYGLTLSRKKPETMVFNGSDDVTTQQSLVKLGDTVIKNSTEFKYLGVMVSSINPKRMIEHRLSSALAKFHEMKKVLQDQRIKCRTRGKFMTSFVRSRLMYNAATWDPHDINIKKLDVEWVRLLRRIVKGGFKRRDAPPKDISEEDKKNGTWDYAYIYSNENIYRITGCGPLTLFQEKQHLKWLAHCVRMDNSCLQKQTLFMETTSRQSGKRKLDRWKKLENLIDIDKTQLRRIMMDKCSFNRWISERYPSNSRS